MRISLLPAAAVWLLYTGATGAVCAQIPRDPLADRTHSASSTAAAPNSAGRQAPTPYVTRQSDMEIPFSVRPGATAEMQPTKVRVFVSWDRGQSWHFYEERKPEDARFRFR
ncbi:MAG TPA: hypothetical protein VGJ16_12440, partial [Pirellulales bacterium]